MIAFHHLLQLLQLRTAANDHQLDFRIFYITKALNGNLDAFFLCDAPDKHDQPFILMDTILLADCLYLLWINIIRMEFIKIQAGRNDIDRCFHTVF